MGKKTIDLARAFGANVFCRIGSRATVRGRRFLARKQGGRLRPLPIEQEEGDPAT